MGLGVKDFDAREAQEFFFFAWGANFSLLFFNQKIKLKDFYEWCLTSEGGAQTII